MRKRKLFPRLLAEFIEPIAAPMLRERGLTQASIIRHWESIVGPELSRHASPHRLTSRTDGGGTLVIRTSGGFATELQHMEPVILERLATYFGYRAVARLKIEQSGFAKRATPAPSSKNNAQMKEALRRLAESLQKEPG